MKRYIGIDYGEKRIGIALGDSESKIAVPFAVANDVQELIKIIHNEEIEEIVIGLPFTMKSESGEMTVVVEKFVQDLKRQVSLPVIEIDERLSSKSADTLLGGRDKTKRDAVAAMVILQTYLDRL